ncbi:hypothetical protein HYU14_05990 [Candidatus Woesearchaeota archaeon]|nr:hypothetical protein [Candidatus Woesearchaeota archaeon]
MGHANYRTSPNGEIAMLLRNRIYTASFKAMGEPDPRISIHNGEDPYWGYLVPSKDNNGIIREKRNFLREEMINQKEAFGKLEVMVISLPRFSPLGPYCCIPNLPVPISPHQLTLEESAEMLDYQRSEGIFFARCFGISKRGDPILGAFSQDGGPVHGFLEPTRFYPENTPKDPFWKMRTSAEFRITSEVVDKARIGDSFYVRQKGVGGDQGSLFFGLIVNFSAEDRGFLPGGERLETAVEHGDGQKVSWQAPDYSSGDVIRCLPVLDRSRVHETGMEVGKGFLPRHMHSPQTFYYMQVLVKGAENDKGIIIDARIEFVSERVIHAVKTAERMG